MIPSKRDGPRNSALNGVRWLYDLCLRKLVGSPQFALAILKPVVNDFTGRALGLYLVGAVGVGSRNLLDTLLAFRRVRDQRTEAPYEFGKMKIVAGRVRAAQWGLLPAGLVRHLG